MREIGINYTYRCGSCQCLYSTTLSSLYRTTSTEKQNKTKQNRIETMISNSHINIQDTNRTFTYIIY